MVAKPKLLIVEDDKNLATVICDYLTICGYEIVHCEDGATAWNLYCAVHPDLCILDVMLPEMDGFSLAQKIRQWNETVPILFLTARSAKEDKIKGFKTGADDYIVKPFNIEELVLRIEVFLKRSNHLIKETDKYRIGNYVFDYSNLILFCEHQEFKLTTREADVLRMLYLNKNNVTKREDILKQIWGNDDYFLGRSLDVFISKLRKYLLYDSDVKITNYHSVGFRLVTK